MMSEPSLRPGEGAANKQLIDMLLRSRLFRDYESVFTKATGLPLALRPLEYWQLAHHGKKNENAFCAMLAERPATLGRLFASPRKHDSKYGRHAAHGNLPIRFNRDRGASEARREKRSAFSGLARFCAVRRQEQILER